MIPWGVSPHSLIPERDRSRWFVQVPEWWEAFEAPRFLFVPLPAVFTFMERKLREGDLVAWT